MKLCENGEYFPQLSTGILPVLEDVLTFLDVHQCRSSIAYIRDNREKDAVFSGWSWSLPFYLDLDAAGDHITKDRSTYPFEQRENVPEYFIVSPEFPLETLLWGHYPAAAVNNTWNREHNEKRVKFLTDHCVQVKTFSGPDHQWVVYKVISDNLNAVPPPAQGGSYQGGS